MNLATHRATHRVANRAAVRLLPRESEAGLDVRPVDDEAHHDGFHPTRGIESHEPDVVAGKGLAAALQFQHHAGGILEIEHRYAEHLPVSVSGMRVIGVLDAPGIAFVESVLDLQRYFRIREIR